MSDSKAALMELNMRLKALRLLWSDMTSHCRQTVMQLSETNKDLRSKSVEYLPDLFWKVISDRVAEPDTFLVESSFGQLSLKLNQPVEYISSCITVNTGFGKANFAELYTYRYSDDNFSLFRLDSKGFEISNNDELLES